MILGYRDFYYNVTNIEKALMFNKALGLEVVHADEYWASLKLGNLILGEDDAPWGHMLVFEDCDGNVLKLMNPKN